MAQQGQAGEGDDRAGQSGRGDLGESPGDLQERGPPVPADDEGEGSQGRPAGAGGGQCPGDGRQVPGGGLGGGLKIFVIIK